jgi:hypothetical protein
MTTIQASHHNGSTTPHVAKWQNIIPMGNLNGCRAITTLPYNCRGVPIASYAFKGQYTWVVGLRHDYSTSITISPVTKYPKIKPMGNLNGCRAVTTWPYNCRGDPNALYYLTGQCNWVVGIRHDYSTHITSQLLYNTPCGQIPKNQTVGQRKWLPRSNLMTIQLQSCSYCFTYLRRAMQLSDGSKAWLHYTHHTITIPQ